MSLNGKEEMPITDERLEAFISEFRDESHGTLVIVKEFSRTIKETIGELSSDVKVLATQMADQNIQIIQLLSTSKSERERVDIIFENTAKTLESIADHMKKMDGRLMVVENDNIENSTKVQGMPDIFHRLRAVEQSVAVVNGNEIQDVEKLVNELENRLTTIETEIDVKKQLAKFWVPILKWFGMGLLATGVAYGALKAQQPQQKSPQVQSTTGTRP